MKKILALCLVIVLAVTAVTGVTLAYFTDTTQKQTNVFTMGDIEITLDETNLKYDPKDPDSEERTTEDQTFGVLMPGISYTKDPTITIKANSEDCYLFLEVELNKYVSLLNLMGIDYYHLTNDPYPGFEKFAMDLADKAELREAVLNRWLKTVVHKDWKIMNMDEIKADLAKVATSNNPDSLSIKLGYIGDKAEDNIIKKNTSDIAVKFMDEFTMPATITEEMFDGDLAYYRPDDTEKEHSMSNFNTNDAKFKLSFTAHAIQATVTDGTISNIDTAYEQYLLQNN